MMVLLITMPRLIGASRNSATLEKPIHPEVFRPSNVASAERQARRQASRPEYGAAPAAGLATPLSRPPELRRGPANPCEAVAPRSGRRGKRRGAPSVGT